MNVTDDRSDAIESVFRARLDEWEARPEVDIAADVAEASAGCDYGCHECREDGPQYLTGLPGASREVGR